MYSGDSSQGYGRTIMKVERLLAKAWVLTCRGKFIYVKKGPLEMVPLNPIQKWDPEPIWTPLYQGAKTQANQNHCFLLFEHLKAARRMRALGTKRSSAHLRGV